MSKDIKILNKINEQIVHASVRLVNQNGDMVGVVTNADALSLAAEAGLDLVEISPTATPPVCKIMDFGKFKYEAQKKAHEAKKNQKVVELKEIKIRPTIAEGDYKIKFRNACRFLKEGNKVRISLMFRGREITHNEVGFALMTRFQQDVADLCRVDSPPRMEGRQIFMLLSPK